MFRGYLVNWENWFYWLLFNAYADGNSKDKFMNDRLLTKHNSLIILNKFYKKMTRTIFHSITCICQKITIFRCFCLIGFDHFSTSCGFILFLCRTLKKHVEKAELGYEHFLMS